MMNPSLGHRAYQCHQYVHPETELRYVLVSYSDHMKLIHFAHYIQHPDGFTGAYVEGVCPAKEDYEMIKEHFNSLIKQQCADDAAAKLYRSNFSYYTLNGVN